MSNPSPMPGQATETAEHHIVAETLRGRDVPRYTCACGETVEAAPEVLDEAFTFHLRQSVPPEVAASDV